MYATVLPLIVDMYKEECVGDGRVAARREPNGSPSNGHAPPPPTTVQGPPLTFKVLPSLFPAQNMIDTTYYDLICILDLSKWPIYITSPPPLGSLSVPLSPIAVPSQFPLSSLAVHSQFPRSSLAVPSQFHRSSPFVPFRSHS
jgi:hypothetical protein